MIKSSVKIYARVKPLSSRTQSEEYHINHHPESDTDSLIFNRHLIDFKAKNLTFRFHKVFDQMAAQEDVFQVVAKPLVHSFLAGYNGTVLAYGQTGSGKTFTMCGDHSRRGIIPRSVEHIFQLMLQDSSCKHVLYISYLEIYNERGYDLLQRANLPLVTLLEDEQGCLHLRNLSLHPVTSEQEALNLLLLGDSNRVVAETSMNARSSRSHCIFTLHLASRSSSSAVICRSKLNIVDLAGSERVHKTQMNGQTLMEARHINLSLHFLEQVIVALGEASRSHIPYRNSMMTSILRDSLGGNSLTVMVATLSLSASNINETVSTCRFAKRVVLLQNQVTTGRQLSPQEEIVMLRAEVQRLRTQLGQNESSPCDVDSCWDQVQEYLRSEPGTEFVLHSSRERTTALLQPIEGMRPAARRADLYPYNVLDMESTRLP